MTTPAVVRVTVPSGPTVVRVATVGPVGPAGPTGPTGVGAEWQQGEGVPGAGVGSNGDFYLNTDTGDIYGPKTAGAWGSVVFNIAEGQQGPAGATGADGDDGDDGREIELQASSTHVQWRYVGDASWTDLIALSAITGPAGADGNDGADGADGAAGADGQEIELQASGTHIQWRYVGAPSWTDLIALSELEGPQGPAGTPAVYSDATPQALGATAAAGTAAEAARADHVHARPTPADIGAVGVAAAFQVVNHGSTAGTARPAGAPAVYWIGTVEPTNALDGDLWIGGA